MDDHSDPFSDEKDLPFEFRKKVIDNNLQAENWRAVEAVIRQDEKPVSRLAWLRPVMVAASILLVFGLIFYWQGRSNQLLDKINTSYGELRRISLPDGSLVVLNANSTISIPQIWPEKGDRQIWLEGEAYFEISKKRVTMQRFIVHTADIDIEVLGTRFNVNTRHKQSIVSLEEGKIRLSENGNAPKLLEAKRPVILKPGEVAIVNDVHSVAVNMENAVSYHSGWTRNEYHFDNTSLSEIAKMIKDNYGYEVVAEDESIFDRRISGDLRAASLQELIKVLEVAFKIKVSIDYKTMHLQAI